MKPRLERWEILVSCAIIAAGLALRLHLALITYLNPDEAMHALLSFGTWSEVLRQSLLVTHPPLLILITHSVLSVSQSELALRLVPVLAGSVFPILAFLWLRRIAGPMAAMMALFLLTMAPQTISVSAQLRSYTLAFLFLCASLLLLDWALAGDRWWKMALFNLALWGCIVSDYSMAWFVGSVAIYALMRLGPSSPQVKAVWAAGQILSFALYVAFLKIQVQALRAAHDDAGWLDGAFPASGELLVFAVANTVKQFAYLMASIPLGVAALVGFAISMFSLWTGRTRIEPRRARSLAALLTIPFLLGIAGAFAHVFPYGRSRHTLVLGFFIAIGVSIFVGMLPRRVSLAILCVALLLTPLWLWKGDVDPMDLASGRNRKVLLTAAIDYMRATIPPNTTIFTEGETALILTYYLGPHPRVFFPTSSLLFPNSGGFFERPLGAAWRIAGRDYKYETIGAYEEALRAFRRHYELRDDDPVWVLDGGWNTVSRPPDPAVPFTQAIRIFQAGAR